MPFDPLDASLFGRDDREDEKMLSFMVQQTTATSVPPLRSNAMSSSDLVSSVNATSEWIVLPPLTWREDPEVTLSDWKIEVSHCNAGGTNNIALLEENSSLSVISDEEQQVFFVHRNVLANASQYFRGLFRQQHQQGSMEELRSHTSTFQFHPRACQVFGILLDYIYSPPVGRRAFTPHNAMALRHLAQYLGIPSLLHEITHILLADMVTLRHHKRYIEDAAIFMDEKIVFAVKKQIDLQSTLTDMVQSTFDVLSNDIGKFFIEQNVHVMSWSTIMKSFDMGNDVFFAMQNHLKFPDVLVYGAGLEAANGVYRLVGSNDGVGRYSNGLFDLVRYRDSDWNICFGYGRSDNEDMSNNSMSIENQSPQEVWEWDWIDIMHIYDCDSETDSPPKSGWKVVEVYEVPEAVIKQMEPAPCILVLPPRKDNSNNDTIQHLLG
jgi:hypothetical protein